MRSLQALIVSVLLVVAAAMLPAGKDGTASRWAPIPARDLNSLMVQQVARFAVIVHNITRAAGLVFVVVVRGETERPADGGTSYRLVLSAESAPGGRMAEYQCEVWGVLGSLSNTWKLLSFTVF